MVTKHILCCADAKDLDGVSDESIHLIVTSPPYPMIGMWDEDFTKKDPTIAADLKDGRGKSAFEKMHTQLDEVWRACSRVVVPGGMVCVNIGDATRSIAGRFRLYSNHSRIVTSFEHLGFQSLPLVLWRKQTNSPTKFMGSGMLPAGAYVTLEHEYVLIFRKGGKRMFKDEATKKLRRQSALFWEERNTWFSDIWDFKGARQLLRPGEKGGLRTRSAAFPFELAYRLVHMYSLQGETVLDPFIGTGTTMSAAMAGARNCIGFEIDPHLTGYTLSTLSQGKAELNSYNSDRLRRHREFMTARLLQEKPSKNGKKEYRNRLYGFPVVTSQELDLEIPMIEIMDPTDNGFTVRHLAVP